MLFPTQSNSPAPPPEKLWRALALVMALAASSLAALPARAAALTFTATAAGYNSGYALASDGNLYAWGNNAYGQLGNGSTVNSPVPVRVDTSAVPASALPFAAIAAGYDSGYALAPDGSLYAWGYNNYGELGNGSTANSSVPAPVQAPAGVTFTAIASGYATAYGLTPDGKIYAWGWNDYGQLGNNATADSPLPVPVQPGAMPAGVTFTAVAGGRNSGYGLGSDGKIYAWGYNAYGQLGNNSTANSHVPVLVQTPAGVTFTAIAAAYDTGYGLASNGSIYAWGRNVNGELGNGLSADSHTPVLVQAPAGVTFTAIAAGGYTGCALASDGKLYAWGNNGYGQLGNNSTAQSNVPVQTSAAALPAGVTFTAVATGGYSTYALASDGSLYAWGWNTSGQLGNNSSANSRVPVLVFIYAISLSETASITFPAAPYGYAAPPAQDVTVSNEGNQGTGALAIALSGADAGKFQLSAATLASLTASGAGASTVFTVSPATDLPAGTYTATVTVSPATSNPVAPQAFDVSFTVNPATPAAADFSFTPASAAYTGSPQSVTVSPIAGITGMGAVTAVYYNGSATPPASPGNYAITVDVAAGANYAAVAGLNLGNFVITPTATPTPASVPTLDAWALALLAMLLGMAARRGWR